MAMVELLPMLFGDNGKPSLRVPGTFAVSQPADFADNGTRERS
jgi:hypothetical protein